MRKVAILRASFTATAEDIGEVIEALERAGYEVRGRVLGVYEIYKR